jgi:hypothetical protein
MAITTDFQFDEEGMTVPYPPLFDDIRSNHGFVDIRGRPDLAYEIFEGTQSPALKELLVQLSRPHSSLFTLGCDLGTKADGVMSEPHIAGGYIQLMSASYADESPEAYEQLGDAISEALEAVSDDHDWRVHFVLKLVVLTLDDFSGLAPSLWIWFHAAAHTPGEAADSREVLVTHLRNALADDRVNLVFEQWRDEPDNNEVP